MRPTTQAGALPDFTGVWKLDVENSRLEGPVPEQTLMRIEHRGVKLSQDVCVTRADGSRVRQAFAFEIGGETRAAIAGMETLTRAQWRGEVLVVATRMRRPDREARLRDHWSLSSDGAVLTMAHPDDDLAGQVSILKRMPDGAFPPA